MPSSPDMSIKIQDHDGKEILVSVRRDGADYLASVPAESTETGGRGETLQAAIDDLLHRRRQSADGRP